VAYNLLAVESRKLNQCAKREHKSDDTVDDGTKVNLTDSEKRIE